MIDNRRTWLQRATEVLRALGDRPWLLLCTVLALNAVARPYRHLSHDARLYGIQTLNRVHDGAFNSDLFFRFGSQDQFSIFSTVFTPIVRALGVDWAFFLVFLIANFLLFWAFQRLVFALLEDRVLSVLSMFFLAVTPLPYGGLQIFHVQEPFLTPRLLANAFVIFGLERAYRGYWVSAFLLQISACLLHPLMAFGGLCVVTLLWLGEKFGWKKTAVGVGVLAALGIVVLAVPSVATRVFGHMDSDWRDLVRLATPYNFPIEWYMEDWINIFVSFAVAIGAWTFLRRENARCANLLAVAVIVGVVGFLTTCLATALPYALLLQGQPYRAVWMINFLQVPFAVWLVVRVWKIGPNAGYAGLITFLLYFGVSTGMMLEIWLPIVFLPFFVLGYRAAGASKHPHWAWKSLVGSVLCGMFLWSIYTFIVILMFRDELFGNLHLIRALIYNVGALDWLAIAILALMFFYRRVGFGRIVLVSTAALILLANGTFFAMQAVPTLREAHVPEYEDVQFVQHFLQKRRATTRPVLYSNLGQSRFLWFDWRVISFFDRNQVSGVMFNRQTAVEGLRRADLVRRFEIERVRELSEKKSYSDSTQQNILTFFQTDLSCPEPTVRDLVRLAKEDIDYIVVKHEFPGLYSATNGRVYIYERSRLWVSAVWGLAEYR